MSLLDRYILRDILKTLLLTASILVSVIAFGAAIKPLADDELLSAAQVVKYIGLAMIPMLQFALPFSAGFAATLVLHRMTSDNEVQAMSASGVSYRRISAPVLGLGLALFAVMVGLTQWVIPRFWGLMEAMIAADVTRIFEASIARGEPFEMGGVEIYADSMLVVDHPPDTGADTRLVLFKVAAAELDGNRRIVTDVTAPQATVDVHRRDGQTFLKLAITDLVYYNRASGQLGTSAALRPRAIPVSNALSDNPLTMSQGRLLELHGDPDGFRQVQDAKAELAATIRDAELFTTLDAALRRDGRITLARQGPMPRTFEIRAAGLRDGAFVPGADGVEVTERGDEGREVRRYRAAESAIRRGASPALASATFQLDLADVEVADSGGDRNRRAALTLEGLAVPDDGAADLADLDSAALLARAASRDEPSAAVTRRASDLERMLRELKDDIISKLNERYALSVTAPLLLALGSLLAMLLRRSLPLTVYVWAFLPSVIDLILISSGAQLIRDGRMDGIAILWSGNAVLALLSAFVYWRLARN